MGTHDPIMVVPQCFTHITAETQSLRDQIEANTDDHILSDPHGVPDTALFTKHWDGLDGSVQDFWEAHHGGI